MTKDRWAVIVGWRTEDGRNKSEEFTAKNYETIMYEVDSICPYSELQTVKIYRTIGGWGA